MHADLEQLVEHFERGRLSRRQLIVHLTGLLGAGTVLTAGDREPSSTFKATEINHVALSVKDVSRSRVFYEKHLGLELRSDDSPHSCFLNCGRDFLALFRAERPGMDHYCYSIDHYDPSEAVKRLKAAGLEPRRRSNRVYFDDPDGLEVQVSAPNR